MKTFPAKPRPEKNESFVGYLIRISFLHGYESLHTLHYMLDVRYRQHYLGDISELLNALSAALDMQTNELKSYFDFSNEVAYDSQRAIVDIRLHNPRLCPTCLKEGKVLQEGWQYPHITHCWEHHVPLIDACPACNTPLTWHGVLMEKCPHCEFEWTQYSALPEALPQHMKTLNLQIGHGHVAYLRGLYQCLIYCNRVLDFTSNSYNTMPPVRGPLSTMFEHAFALLVSPSYQKAWRQLRERHMQSCLPNTNDWKLSYSHPALPLNKDHYTPSKTEVDVMPSAHLENGLFVAAAHSKHLATLCDAKFLLEVADIAALLELSPTTIVYLAEQQLLGATKGGKSSNTWVFDARTIPAFFESWTPCKAHKKYQGISLRQLCEQAGYFDVADKNDCGVVVEALIRNKVSYCKTPNQSWLDAMHFEREEALFALEKAFVSQFTKTHPKTRIKHCLCLSSPQYLALRDHFQNELVLEKNQHRYLPPGSLKQLLAKHTILRRWCALRGENFEKALEDNKANIVLEYPSLISAGLVLINTTNNSEVNNDTH